MSLNWTPTEEHFIKKELLRREIASEFDRLSPQYHDISGLRRFGPPFLPLDPQMVHHIGIDLQELHEIAESTKGVVREQFPILRFVLERFVVTFPFIKIHLLKLGDSWLDQLPFWLKIQNLFEIWKSKKISNSNDRGVISKRELTLSKIKSLILMLFNTGIKTVNEDEYFQKDKEIKGAYKKLGKLITVADQQKLQNLEIEEAAAVAKTDLNSVDPDEYINGWYVNVVGVSNETEVKKGMIWGTREAKYYTFIMRVQRESDDEGWYVKRRYGDFRTLALELKKLYPNVKRPYLPSKDKQSGHMVVDDEAIEEGDYTPNMNNNDNADDLNIDINELLEENFPLTAPPTPTVETPKSSSSGTFKIRSPKSPSIASFNIGKLEKSFKNTLKVPLKGHRRSMSNASANSIESTMAENSNLPRESLRMALRGYIKSITKREPLSKSPELVAFLSNNPVILTPEEVSDVQNRIKLDHLVTLQHLKFQKVLVKAVGELEVEVLKMKDILYNKGFNYLFDEVKANKNIDDLSGPIKSIIEVVKLEIASTLYEMLIGSDSAPEFYRVVKRMHHLMPYKMMGTILRFTNPLQMVKKFIDLFTFQPFGKGKSLLQMIFMGSLSDDVKKYDDELKSLKERLHSERQDCIYRRIDEYFTSDDDIVLKVKQLSKTTSIELPVAILLPNNGLSSPDVPQDILVDILKDFKNEVRRDDSTYTLAVRYFQIKLRRWDKEMMRELWEANEMMDVIKDLMAIFFEPLIDLFKKADVYKYVPIFQKFMNELINVCDDYIYQGSSSKGDIVVGLISLEDKYSPIVYKFMRDIYMNDLSLPEEARLFEGMIRWLNNFLDFLRMGDSDKRLNLGALISSTLGAADQQAVRTHISVIVQRVAQRKKQYTQIEGAERRADGANGVAGNWDKIHGRVFEIGAAVGMETIELESDDDDDLDLDPDHYGSGTLSANSFSAIADSQIAAFVAGIAGRSVSDVGSAEHIDPLEVSKFPDWGQRLASFLF